jgi:hypothetical protein
MGRTWIRTAKRGGIGGNNLRIIAPHRMDYRPVLWIPDIFQERTSREVDGTGKGGFFG